MPSETTNETMPERAIREDSEYTADRSILTKILLHKLKFIGLNIAKVMMDIREDGEKYPLMYDDAKLLELLGDDLNDSVVV